MIGQLGSTSLQMFLAEPADQAQENHYLQFLKWWPGSQNWNENCPALKPLWIWRVEEHREGHIETSLPVDREEDAQVENGSNENCSKSVRFDLFVYRRLLFVMLCVRTPANLEEDGEPELDRMQSSRQPQIAGFSSHPLDEVKNSFAFALVCRRRGMLDDWKSA
jgi:hypothetical protein